MELASHPHLSLPLFHPAVVHCSNIDPSAYSGYEIELFKKIQRILGWKNDQINWLCIGNSLHRVLLYMSSMGLMPPYSNVIIIII